MKIYFVLAATLVSTLSHAQVPQAPNTQPKQVNEPFNGLNVGDGAAVPGGNPGLGANASAGITDQMREAADQDFAIHVAQQTMTRIALGKLAASNSASEGVKTYAEQMIKDNARINERLKRVAARGSVTIPAMLDARSQTRVDKLAKLHGEDFDRAFVRDQVRGGERNLLAYQQELQKGGDPGLQMLATRAIPIVEKQMEAAKELEKTMKPK